MRHLTIYLVYMLCRRRPSVNFGGTHMTEQVKRTIVASSPLILPLFTLGAEDFLAQGREAPQREQACPGSGLSAGRPGHRGCRVRNSTTISPWRYQSLGQIPGSPGCPRKRACTSRRPHLSSKLQPRGMCYFKQGDFAAAEEAYSRSLGLAPDFNSNILNRANARLQQVQVPGELKGLQDSIRN
jgi:tetratricopeptide (TPR) repeat protein